MSERWDSADMGKGGYNPLLAMPDKLGEPMEVNGNSTVLRFRPLYTNVVALLFTFFCVLYGTAAIWVFHWQTSSREFEYNAIAHAIYFFIVALIDRVFFGMHKRYQARGYLRLYRQTNFLRQVPYLTASLGNALTLLLWGTVSVSEISCDVRNLLLKILVCGETVIVIGSMVIYTVIICRHNIAKELPDAQKSMDHSMMTPMVDDDSWDPSGTWREGSEGSVVSRQADMIKFLQEQQQNLSREILVLNDKLKRAEVSPTCVNSKDESVLVSQKEQERRYLQVERDQLEETVRLLREESKNHQAMVTSLRKTVREQAETISTSQKRERTASHASSRG